jgi:hypothetical protein
MAVPRFSPESRGTNEQSGSAGADRPSRTGFRFFFYSNESREPPHVHVRRAEGYAKVWLDTLIVADMNGFSPSRVREIVWIIRTHHTSLVEAWHEHFRD